MKRPALGLSLILFALATGCDSTGKVGDDPAPEPAQEVASVEVTSAMGRSASERFQIVFSVQPVATEQAASPSYRLDLRGGAR